MYANKKEKTMSKILKEANLKQTKSRALILTILKNSPLPISAEDVYKLVNKKTPVNLSTVYRTLNTLSKKGVLLSSVMYDKKTYYQISTHAHKHILVCEVCKSQTPIEECPMHHLEDKIERETGFLIHGHNLEIFGICKQCQQKQTKTS
jgi:Fur family ferric uptake transcriptional regulator